MRIRWLLCVSLAGLLPGLPVVAVVPFDAVVFRTGFEAFTCPNAVVEDAETCDDGAAAAGDGCSDRCRIEFGFYCAGAPSICVTDCGDGAPAGAEACDNGNVLDGDGCSAMCTVEQGFQCSGAPSVCTASCGDGLLAPGAGEVCDDGNPLDSDGCSATCAIEPGFMCSGSPSVCSTVCGDGLVAGTEACDDGDAFDGNGCSAQCAVEAGYQCTGSPSLCLTGSCTTNISGTAGDDPLVGTTGDDCMFGFGGNDSIQGDGGRDALAGGDGDDLLRGGAGDDALDGGRDNGNDTLDGGPGVDTLNGGTGTPSVPGSTAFFTGNDLYIVTAGDTIMETSTRNAEIDTVRADFSYTLGANLENLELTGSANLSGTGNSLDNRITGNDGANVLMGSVGDDTLIGGAGDDTLDGGTDRDTLRGGAGADDYVIRDTNFADTIEDFVSLSSNATTHDQVLFDMSTLTIGNGDTTINAPALWTSAASAWSAGNEIVVFTPDVAGLDTVTVAASIEASMTPVPAGLDLIFVRDNGVDTGIYRFTSNGDAVVSAGELDRLVLLSGTASVGWNAGDSDFVFVP